jgi:hypothetical protein
MIFIKNGPGNIGTFTQQHTIPSKEVGKILAWVTFYSRLEIGDNFKHFVADGDSDQTTAQFSNPSRILRVNATDFETQWIRLWKRHRLIEMWQRNEIFRAPTQKTFNPSVI